MIPLGAHNWSVRRMNRDLVMRYAPACHGELLDVGCGERPYEPLLAPHVTSYVGLEHEATPHSRARVDVWGRADALPFSDASFDTVVSFHVLEHTEVPERVLSEAYRVLRPGGTLLITTPFLWGIHEAPRDFFRFTSYGLEQLVGAAGFELVALEAFCGFWATAALRLSYYIARRGDRRLLRWALVPALAAIQAIGLGLDKIDLDETDTAGYLTLAQRTS